MANMDKHACALETYVDLCAAIESLNWHYRRDDDEMVIRFSVTGEDLPMEMMIAVDENRQLVRLLSPLPVIMSEDKRLEGAVATCVANYGLVNGSFDYDLGSGKILFRINASFLDRKISIELLKHLIRMACSIVDDYNDKFFMLNQGLLSLDDIIKNG